jgi:hypothetical protein
MVVVGGDAREDSQDGKLGIDDQQLGNPAGEEDQPEEAGDEEDPQGNSENEAQEGDGVQDDHQVEEEAADELEKAAQESSGFAGKGPFSPDLKERVRQLEKQLADLVAGKMKPGGSFQGVKLRPADPPKFGGCNKDVIKDFAMMVQWLGSGSCVPEQRVSLAQTFLIGGAASL